MKSPPRFEGFLVNKQGEDYGIQNTWKYRLTGVETLSWHHDLWRVDLQLNAEEIKQLDDVSALPVEYPGWMVEWQSNSRIDPLAHKAVEELTAVGK